MPHRGWPCCISAMTRLIELAPAKVNLCLRVLRRRADGYHDLASLVAFAAIGDELSLEPSPSLELSVNGPTAERAGLDSENLVLKAARAFSERIPDAKGGHFSLTKRLPVGAGLGGGSSDAAAALRLLAKVNNIPLSAQRLFQTAKTPGADVPVCVEPKARLMHGIGDQLSSVIGLPKLFSVLLFPGIPVATAQVFQAFELPVSGRRERPYSETEIPRERDELYEYLANEP